ncbi:MAG: hypothetical protein U0610_25020 [bacterium]
MIRYTLFCAALLGGFAYTEWRGVNWIPQAQHAVAPASVRSAPGGYRSYHYYRSGGFRGGK